MASRWDLARIEAYASASSGKWLEAFPSTALATHLSNAQLRYALNQRLGSEARAFDGFCPFCGDIMDARGSHPMTCMCGDDSTLLHNEGRNLLFRHAARGGMAPKPCYVVMPHRLMKICGLQMYWLVESLLLTWVFRIQGWLWILGYPMR